MAHVALKYSYGIQSREAFKSYESIPLTKPNASVEGGRQCDGG